MKFCKKHPMVCDAIKKGAQEIAKQTYIEAKSLPKYMITTTIKSGMRESIIKIFR